MNLLVMASLAFALLTVGCRSGTEPQTVEETATAGATDDDGDAPGGDEPDETAPEGAECPECPPQTVVAPGPKGEGPIATYYPGLVGRPSLESADVDALKDALRDVDTDKIPESPGPGEPTPLTMNPHEIPDDPLEPPPGSRPDYRDRHNMRIARTPWVEITPGGRMVLRWESWVAMMPAFVHFGLDIPDQILDYPRYRKASKESGDRSKKHAVGRGLSSFDSRHFDLVGYREDGGTVHYRIEYRDPVGGVTLFHDGSFAFVRDDSGGYANGVTISEGPHVDVPTPDGMTISFETDVATIGAVVVVPPDGGETRVLLTDEPGTRHEIRVDGLTADTLYGYRVGAIDRRGILGEKGDYAFRTAPIDTRPFRFAVMSDSRSGLGGGERMQHGVNAWVVREFMSEALKRGADMILFPGDLINGVSTETGEMELQYEAWKQASGPVHRYVPIFEGMGNHDVSIEQKRGSPRVDKASPDSSEEVFARNFVNPTNGPPPEREGLPPYLENVYSFDYGKVHFVSVNTNYWTTSGPDGKRGNREGYIMDGQMDWIEADLKAARENGASFIFVYTHEPGFPNGGHVGDAMYHNGKIASVNEMRTRFWSLMSEYEVTAVFHGDEHNYSRLLVDDNIDEAFANPVWQIVTGGCGAPFYGRSTRVPWADRVDVFTAMEHWVMVDVLSDDRAVLTAIGINGETIDRVVFDRTKPAARTDGDAP